MIRRNVLARKDHSIKWSLVAAALALSLGFYAQHAISLAEEDAAATASVEQAEPTPETTAS